MPTSPLPPLRRHLRRRRSGRRPMGAGDTWRARGGRAGWLRLLPPRSPGFGLAAEEESSGFFPPAAPRAGECACAVVVARSFGRPNEQMIWNGYQAYSRG